MNQAIVVELQKVAGVLRSQMVDVITHVLAVHQDLPAQLVMISLGELLIQFSVSHVGKERTLHLLTSLQDAVQECIVEADAASTSEIA